MDLTLEFFKQMNLLHGIVLRCYGDVELVANTLLADFHALLQI